MHDVTDLVAVAEQVLNLGQIISLLELSKGNLSMPFLISDSYIIES